MTLSNVAQAQRRKKNKSSDKNKVELKTTVTDSSTTPSLNTDSLKQQETVDVYHTLQQQIVSSASKKLSVEHAFLNNKKIRIGIPTDGGRYERGLRLLGMNNEVDSVITMFNIIAEQSVNEIKPIILQSSNNLIPDSLQAWLKTSDSCISIYTINTPYKKILISSKEIVKNNSDKIGLDTIWAKVFNTQKQFGLNQYHPNLNAYLTSKTIDGILTTMIEEEKGIRKESTTNESPLIRSFFKN